MQAIQTKYLGPTNHLGARVKAKSQAGSLVVSWDYAEGIQDNHQAAAAALCSKLGWVAPHYGSLISGALPSGEYCHVFTTKKEGV